MKILLTSTSFQDVPGSHQELLFSQSFEVVSKRGPLKETEMVDIIEGFDGVICGDDEITRSVIERGANSKLRVISKYGIGLDKVDLKAAADFGITVTNCPGVNGVTVAEHVFALLLAYSKNLIIENKFIRDQQWKRCVGTELYGKRIAVLGFGSIGREVVKRALAFGMQPVLYDSSSHLESMEIDTIEIAKDIPSLISGADILSLHIPLNDSTRGILGKEELGLMKKGVVVINTARAGLIEESLILESIETGLFGAYLTDVLDQEPMIKDHPFLKFDNILITPHIGSRTHESVVRQGTMAVENLLQNI